MHGEVVRAKRKHMLIDSVKLNYTKLLGNGHSSNKLNMSDVIQTLFKQPKAVYPIWRWYIQYMSYECNCITSIQVWTSVIYYLHTRLFVSKTDDLLYYIFWWHNFLYTQMK